jgi:hypothetical protein
VHSERRLWRTTPSGLGKKCFRDMVGSSMESLDGQISTVSLKSIGSCYDAVVALNSTERASVNCSR